MSAQLPIGCHLGTWHQWGQWTDKGEVILSSTHLPTGTKVETGKEIVQERRCAHCNAVDHRRSRV